VLRAIAVSPCRCGVVGTTTAFGLRRDRVLIEIFATFVDHSDKEEEQRHRQWAEPLVKLSPRWRFRADT
jgi:hypothetical protein